MNRAHDVIRSSEIGGYLALNRGRIGLYRAITALLVGLVLGVSPVFGQIAVQRWYTTNAPNSGVSETVLNAFNASDWIWDDWAVDQAGPVALPTNCIPVWWLSSRTNIATVYFAATGTLMDAASGYVEMTAAWSNTLVSGGRYIASIRAYVKDGSGNNRFIGTLAQHFIDVTEAPDAGEYTMESPVDLSAVVTSNRMGSGATWNGSQWLFGVAEGSGATNASGSGRLTLTYAPSNRTVYGSVDVSGLTTGTPLYAESDTLALTAQQVASNSLQTQVSARAPLVTNPVIGRVQYYSANGWVMCTNMVFLGTNFLFYWNSTNSPARFPANGE